MKKATITRLRSESGDFGTVGKFVMDMLECYSLQLAPRADAKDISCLPPMLDQDAVTYLLQNLWSNEHKRKVYHYTNMRMPDGSWGPLPDGRTVAEVHSGNLAGDISKRMLKQILGCTMLGRAIVVFPKGSKFQAFSIDSPEKMTLCALESNQIGISSSVDAVAAFEAEAAGEDIELTESWG